MFSLQLRFQLASLPGCPFGQNEALFNEKIAPLLKANCAACHGSASPAGGLSMASLSSVLTGGKHGPALEPGDSQHSLLMQYVRGERTPKMPMGGSLPTEAIGIAGDGDRPHAGRSEDGKEDGFASGLAAAQARGSGDSGSEEYRVGGESDRRLCAAEARGQGNEAGACRQQARAAAARVLRSDRIAADAGGSATSSRTITAPDAYEKVVDKLLADSRYGERWARHWLDLARFAESDGFAIDGERPTAWRYRDYVIRSFNQDKPYDRFVEEQLAGDEMPAGGGGGGAARSDRLVALGFLRMGTWEADANFKTQLRQDVLNELTGTVGQVFLGFTVGCARCHDHKYDPIPQQDFYRLQAFFAPMKVDNREAPFSDAEGGSKAMRDKLRTTRTSPTRPTSRCVRWRRT